MSTDPRRERASAWLLFAALAVIGITWSLSTPLMAVPDEPAHVIRAAAVVRGDLVGRDLVTETDDPLLENRTDTYLTVPKAYARLKSVPTCYAFDIQETADCAPDIGEAGADVTASTYVGTYQPLYAAVIGWPSLLLPPEPAIHTMRIVGALVCAALTAIGFLGVRRADVSGFGVVGYLIALTPSVVFFFGSVNPSSLEIAGALAAWGTTLEIARRRGPLTTSAAVRFVVAAVAMAWARPLSALFLAFIVCTIWVITGSRTRLAELRGDRTARVAVAISALSALAAVTWVVWRRAYDSFAGNPWPELTRLDAIRISFEQLWGRVEQMVAVFGWLDTRPPSIVLVAWLGALAALSIAALVVGSTRQRLVIVGLLLVIVVEPTVAEVSRAERYGFVWQGRYSLPLAVGLPILAAVTVGWSGRLNGRARTVVAAVVVAGWAGGQALAHAASMRRYRTGPGTSIVAWLTEGRWEAPVASGALATGLALGLILSATALALAVNPRASWRGG
jgi:hypothetical protein